MPWKGLSVAHGHYGGVHKDTVNSGPQGGLPTTSLMPFWWKWQPWTRVGRKGKRQAEVSLGGRVSCRATRGAPPPASREGRGAGWGEALLPQTCPSFQASSRQTSPQPCTTPWILPWGVRLPGNQGHAGSRGTLGGTYQGTGRCSQGQGLYNSGWHRSWLGNQGNLIRQGDQCQMLYLQFGGGGCITNSPPHSVSWIIITSTTYILPACQALYKTHCTLCSLLNPHKNPKLGASLYR